MEKYTFDELNNVGSQSYGALNSANVGGPMSTLDIVSFQSNLDKIANYKNPNEFYMVGNNCIRLSGLPLLQIKPFDAVGNVAERELRAKKLKAMSLIDLRRIPDYSGILEDEKDSVIIWNHWFGPNYIYAGNMLISKANDGIQTCVTFGQFLNHVFEGNANIIAPGKSYVWKNFTATYTDDVGVPFTKSYEIEFYNGTGLQALTDDSGYTGTDNRYTVTAGQKVALTLMYVFYNYRYQKMDTREFYLSEQFLLDWWDLNIVENGLEEILFGDI